jgi:hypothetical protein
VRRLRGDAAIALLEGLLAFVLYAVTAARSVATLFDDSLEFQVVLPTLGIAHPSGYPLYTLLGKLASTVLPIWDAAGRTNLLSALFAGAAVAMLYLVSRRLAGSRPAAAVATAIFALSPTWWSQATIAEVYALHGLLVAVFLYCLLRWEEDRMLGRSDSWLLAAALVCGLGLAHHRMLALLVPAALVFIFWADPSLLRQPRRWLAPIALGLAPLLLYLYLPIRGQAVTSLDGAYRPTLGGTVDWILARGYSIFLTANPFNVDRQWNDYLALLLGELGALTLLAALLGLGSAFRFSPRRATFLLLATLSQVAFAAAYKVQDVAVFFIPAFMFVCIWAAWGLAPLFDQMAQRGSNAGSAARVPARWMPALLALWLLPVALVMLFEPVRNVVRTWPERDRSDERQVVRQGRDMIESAAEGGRIVGLGGEVTLVRYFRDVLGQRPDLQVTRADGEAERLAAVEAALASGETVYLTRDLPGAAQQYSLDAAGSLVRVSPKALPGPPPEGGQSMGAGVVLLRGEVQVADPTDRAARVVLTWTAAQPITEELKVSARLIDGAGEVVSAADIVPVHFAYPTTAWVPGEAVEDVIDLSLRPEDPLCSYDALIILYRAADASEVGRATLPVGCIGD